MAGWISNDREHGPRPFAEVKNCPFFPNRGAQVARKGPAREVFSIRTFAFLCGRRD
jgi:hypothetical protein